MKIQDEARDRLDNFGDDDKALVRAMIHRIDQLERLYQEDRERHARHIDERRRMERAFSEALHEIGELLKEAVTVLPDSEIGARIRAFLAKVERGSVRT